MKLKIWMNRIMTSVILIIFIFLALIVITSKVSGESNQVFGYQLKTVLSGSMEPSFKTGSIIAIKPGGDRTRYKPGDVITFKRSESMIVTHRVVGIETKGGSVMYQTKGDANNSPDRELVPTHDVIGQYTGFTVPYAGYLFNYASSKWGSALLLIIPGLLLIANAAISVWRDISEVEKMHEAP